jgi:hypothetical protein
VRVEYVVEKIEKGKTIHIGAENIRDAEQILCLISKQHRGSVYPLYSKDILVNETKEDQQCD